MTVAQTIRELKASAPGVGAVRWVPSGRLYWLPEIGPGPVPGDEFARREARLVERLRRTFGSSPYEPVTRDADEAADLLARAMSVAVEVEEGARTDCSCSALTELKGRAGEDYADHHLAYDGRGQGWSAATFHCLTTGAEWELTYPGPAFHGGATALLARCG